MTTTPSAKPCCSHWRKPTRYKCFYVERKILPTREGTAADRFHSGGGTGRKSRRQLWADRLRAACAQETRRVVWYFGAHDEYAGRGVGSALMKRHSVWRTTGSITRASSLTCLNRRRNRADKNSAIAHKAYAFRHQNWRMCIRWRRVPPRVDSFPPFAPGFNGIASTALPNVGTNRPKSASSRNDRQCKTPTLKPRWIK